MKKLIQQEIQKIPQDWISQFGTSDIPQSYLSEKQVRCSLKELEFFLKNFASRIATAAKEEDRERIKKEITESAFVGYLVNEDHEVFLNQKHVLASIDGILPSQKEEVHE